MQKSPSTRVPPELEELTERIGTFIQYWGFKKIHGQIWTHIFLAKTPIAATTLVKRLGVSKALVSLAVGDLIEYNVIRVAGKGSRRKIFLESNSNMSEVICSVLKMRERQLLSQIMASHQKFQQLPVEEKKDLDVDQERATELGLMIEDAELALDSLIAHALDIRVDQR